MNHHTNLTLLLLTRNESENIKLNFSWLKDCPTINEIIVVDDESTDDTVKDLKALKLPKTTKLSIFCHPLNQNFSTQRQFGVSKSKNDWILWLDADETPSTELVAYIQKFAPQLETAFQLSRTDYFEGKVLKHGETSTSFPIRIFNKKQGKFVGKVHEVWQPTTTIFPLKLAIFHHSHPDLKSFLEKINFYSTIRARELYDQKITASAFEIVALPLAKFTINYWLKAGFLDGTPGIIMALTMSFHSFLVRSKLWHLWQK